MVEIAYRDTGKSLYWMSVPKMVMLDTLKLSNIIFRINGLVFYNCNTIMQNEIKQMLLENFTNNSEKG